MKDAFQGRRVVVMGLGHFGGGIAVTRWLVGQGAQVTVTDKAGPEKLAESLQQLEGLPVTYRLGEHSLADLERCDLLVVSPAVPESAPYVQAAVERGIPISSEMNLFLERCPARQVIGITGSAGKSTTTAMTGAVLSAAHEAGAGPRVWVGGNIGKSLLEELERIEPDHRVVLELSSFQLEDMAALRWSPPIALITNIQPNHLDRHGTLDAYADAKMNIVRCQRPDGVVLLHRDQENVAEYVRAAGGETRLKRYAFDPKFADDLQVPGQHNQVNAAGAIAIARALGIGDAHISAGLRNFKGLIHRLEFVAEHEGVRYYNDSKSTTPESTCIALEAFEAPVVMMVGGRDKGMPLTPMSRALAAKAKAVICYGEMGPAVAAEVTAQKATAGRPVQVRTAGSLEDAAQQARAVAAPGDVVVLSPAFTSYDQFSNYEERGETFCRIVRGFAS